VRRERSLYLASGLTSKMSNVLLSVSSKYPCQQHPGTALRGVMEVLTRAYAHGPVRFLMGRLAARRLGIRSGPRSTKGARI
jgi:hypothetical protein